MVETSEGVFIHVYIKLLSLTERNGLFLWEMKRRFLGRFHVSLARPSDKGITKVRSSGLRPGPGNYDFLN
jgi:hypothetical protein